MKRGSETGWRPLTRIGRLRIGLLLGWLFVYLILLVAGGCTQSEVEEDVIPPHALKDVEAGFNLHVLANQTPVTRSITCRSEGTIDADTLVAAVSDTVRTRAAAPLSEIQENKIASLWVGQYDATSGTRLFSQYISSMADNTVNVKLKQSQSGAKSRVWFVANAGDLGEVATEKALKERTLTHKSTGEGLPEDNLCKMTGTWEGIVQEGGVKEVTVNLKRLLARITFTYSMGNDFAFTPTSVILKNAPSVSQVEAPTGQLTTGVTYSNYTGTANNAGATVYWYLPENMAGTVSGENAVDSEKKKTGKGVTNATCIVLSGDAVQGGVTYKDVSFTFYPGSNMNNYDIIRNSHYTMTVTLVGIDASDERITVGEIPPIEVDPSEMPANKGGEKDIQITARPGQPWEFNMPEWLSAVLDGKDIPTGATITHQGPANVVFKAVSANPKAEKRSVSFNIEVNGVNQEITITQSGSTLTKGNAVSLTATKNSEGESSFTATEGLQWLAALSDGDGWLGWSTTNPGTSGSEAPAGAQILKVKTTAANPSAQARSGKIIVKAGASVGDATYTGLKQEIAVSQAGSTVNGSTINSIAAKGATGDASFTATAGLAWASSVTSGSWITLNSGGSGTPTTGGPQTINYTATVNPSSSPRSGTVTVRAGDASVGPTGSIVLNQSGATLNADAATKTVAAIASTGNTSTFTATAGLSWNVGVASTGNWLSLTGTTSGTNNTTDAAQTITYNAVVNPDASTRQGTITVKVGNAVNGTDAGLTKTIAVTQEASSLTASGSKITLAATKGDEGTFTFKGTSGLSFSVTKPDWLTLTGTTSGTTNGADQTFGYKTNAVNLNSTERAAANISVKAGNITKNVEIKQSGSTFTVDKTEIELENIETSGSVKVTGTDGLPWTVTPSVQTNGITPGTTSETANGGAQTVTFSSTANTGGAREVTFTIAVTGGNHSKEVKVKQKAGLTNTVTIDQAIADAYKAWNSNTAYPPFNYDNGNVTGGGSDYKGNSSAYTISTPYTVEVESTQSSSTYVYNNSAAKNYCTGKGAGWRLPTQIELFAMWTKCKGTNNDATDNEDASTALGAKFISYYYWSSSVSNGSSNNRCVLYFTSGGFNYSGTDGSRYVRCVRDN
ncbi:BACON domain-containing carbohydrate-binding protein [uncultured Parabacteroides sp.]|uniref:BACON domain-containing protein n=1 Tax=uncultured Parabacteroides sp. TaxID=512312 RepID=UPI0025E411C3|nr:BACON domain-containing carbohydrate-binding protein [uncultured Parabacteroides sp.]